MKADLARLVQSVERFIPKEELEAMRMARGEGARGGGGGGEDAALLERFARLNPLEGGEKRRRRKKGCRKRREESRGRCQDRATGKDLSFRDVVVIWEGTEV